MSGCLARLTVVAIGIGSLLAWGAWYPAHWGSATDAVLTNMARHGVNVTGPKPAPAPPAICRLLPCGQPPPAARSGPGVVYSEAELQRALEAAGVPSDRAHVGAAIAEAESGGRSDAVCASCAGIPEFSVGPWQINLQAHRWVTQGCAEELHCAATAAAAISGRGSNWTPWSTYVSGAWRRFA